MNYRFDVRDKKVFIKDIHKWHRVENKIASVFEKRLTDSLGRTVTIQVNGCGMDGRYLEDHEVTTAPDFLIVVDDAKRTIPLEIKASGDFLNVFHIKVDQVRSYLEFDPDLMMLMVRGTKAKNPVFTLMRPSMFVQHEFPVVKFATWGNKKCYRLFARQFHWEPLYSAEKLPVHLLEKNWLLTELKELLAVASC